jgi:predicted RNase H-like nuclease (RuvC/YqgF family)
MDLILTPDIYEPSMDDNGNIIDKIPSWSCLKGKGIMCACGSRKNKVYETSALFTTHIKSQTHKKWILKLNADKVNYYMENNRLKQIIQELREILNRYETNIARINHQHNIELANKEQVIQSLTSLLSEMPGEKMETDRQLDFMNV